MSNIIKAEYVVIDNNHINTKLNKIEHQEPKAINTPREELYELYNQREIILKEANDEALKIINTAKRNVQFEIAELKKRGYEEGYNAGMEIGKNKGYTEGYELGKVECVERLQKQNNAKITEIIEMLKSIENEKEEILNKYEQDLVKLSFEIGEKIIKHKIETQDGIITNILENVIKDYRNVEWVKIYISDKDDVIAVQADKKLINSLNKISSDVKIEVLADLDKGSAIVETPDGIIDASINTQLNNLKEMVLNKNAG